VYESTSTEHAPCELVERRAEEDRREDLHDRCSSDRGDREEERTKQRFVDDAESTRSELIRVC